jgi:hypothetical protein
MLSSAKQVDDKFHFCRGDETMKAVVTSEQGAKPEVAEVAKPQPAAGEVLVKVQASSVNGFDLSVAGGHLVAMMEHRFPVVLGKDFAGTVESTGPGAAFSAHRSNGPAEQTVGQIRRRDDRCDDYRQKEAHYQSVDEIRGARRFRSARTACCSGEQDEETRKSEAPGDEDSADDLVTDVPRVGDPEQDDSDEPPGERHDQTANQQQDDCCDVDPPRFVRSRRHSP